MSVWRVYCLRNSTLQQIYFGCSADVQRDVRALEEAPSSALSTWDFKEHDVVCFDLDDHTDEQRAIAATAKYRESAAPDGWTVISDQ